MVYDVIIQYNLGNTNVVGDTLSQKSISMGSLAYLRVTRRPLSKEILTLVMSLMQFGMSKRGRVFTSVELRPIFLDQIKAKQFEDAKFNKIRNKVVYSEIQKTALDVYGVLRMRRPLCMPHVDDVIPSFLVEVHGS